MMIWAMLCFFPSVLCVGLLTKPLWCSIHLNQYQLFYDDGYHFPIYPMCLMCTKPLSIHPNTFQSIANVLWWWGWLIRFRYDHDVDDDQLELCLQPAACTLWVNAVISCNNGLSGECLLGWLMIVAIVWLMLPKQRVAQQYEYTNKND